MNRLQTTFVLLAMLSSAARSAEPAEIDQLAWLGGCWASESAEPGSGEHWMPLAGGTLLGISRTVKQGRTVAFEFMQIRTIDDGRLAFIAMPSGQSLTEFPLLRIDADEALFENPQHDFPQRVAYRRNGDDALVTRIEGKRGESIRVIEFPLRRIACDAPSPR